MQSILIWLRLFLQGAQKRKPPAQDAGGLPSIIDQDSSGYAANFK
jgi:hypothetical protein